MFDDGGCSAPGPPVFIIFPEDCSDGSLWLFSITYSLTPLLIGAYWVIKTY